MPVESEQTVSITCDNPNCMGNELDPADRTGWTFITHEVYGQPTQQNVYCCPMCAGTITEVLEEEAAKLSEQPENTLLEEAETEISTTKKKTAKK